ncbi:MAG: tripartite tricarboxylate transporter TctB family protein [Clostridiaceae bacterium]|nr:tripartite tricarboxylate transporter TctB family protein [Clostridiaceae bacterium]
MKTMDQKLGWILLLMTGGFYYLTSQLPKDAAFYPLFITIILAALSILFLIKAYKDSNVEEKPLFKGLELKQLAFITAACGGYVALINVLGYFVATFLYFIVVLFGLKVERNKLIIISIGFCGFIFILFKLLLRVRLPEGLII